MINPVILAIVASVLYISIKDVNVRIVPANIVIPVLLVLILVPGLLLTIPPNGKGLLMSGQSSNIASIVHGVVVGLIFAFLIKKFPEYY